MRTDLKRLKCWTKESTTPTLVNKNKKSSQSTAKDTLTSIEFI